MEAGGSGKRLGESVAEEVRALLARRRISAAQFAKEIGRSQPYFSRRLNGNVSFDLDDLEAIALALDVDVAELIRKAKEGATQDFERAPDEQAVTIGQAIAARPIRVSPEPPAKPKTRPFSQPKPGTTRPVSAVPARTRRPARVSQVKRPKQR